MQETLLDFEWAAPLRRILIGSGRRAIFKKGTKHPGITLATVLEEDPEYLGRLVGRWNFVRVAIALDESEIIPPGSPTAHANWPLTPVCPRVIHACDASHLYISSDTSDVIIVWNLYGAAACTPM